MAPGTGREDYSIIHGCWWKRLRDKDSGRKKQREEERNAGGKVR